MNIVGFIMALLVFCGVCNAILEHVGIKTGQKFFKMPFHVLARIVLLPLELLLYLVSVCFLASPLIRKEGRGRGKRKKQF